jgi:predicted DsbA family dithiol-disulfide isomerase
VRWRSFELDPSAPAVRDGSYVGRLAAKYRVPPAEAQAMIDRITDAGAGVGLTFRFDIARPGRTFDAHRLIHLGAHRGRQGEVKERLLAATFLDGEAIGEPATLLRLGVDAGLDGDEVRRVLDTDAFAADVRADERQAADLGIGGVPFFVVDRRYGVSGAQPPEVLAELLERAWADGRPVATG